MTKTIKTGGHTFQARKVPAYPDQMLLAKAALPLYQDVIPIIVKVLSDTALMTAIREKRPPRELILEIMDLAFTAMRRMSEDDLLKLTQRALVCVEVQQQGGWAPVMLPDGSLMFEKLELPSILELIWAAVEVNLGNFFAESLGISQGAGTKAA